MVIYNIRPSVAINKTRKYKEGILAAIRGMVICCMEPVIITPMMRKNNFVFWIQVGVILIFIFV